MEACWSFKSLVGSSCGFDAKDRKRQNQIVPLVSCSKDISKHLGGRAIGLLHKHDNNNS